MIHDVFTFYDTKSGLHSIPFFSTNRATGIRVAIEIAGTTDTPIGRHPNDFVLYRIGTYDDNSGVLRAEVPENLGVCATFIVPVRNQNLSGQ